MNKRLLAVPGLLLLILVLGTPSVALADRFGPPWMARVVVDQATVRAEPMDDSAVVGALPRDAVVVVLDRRDEWTRVPDGWLPWAQVDELFEPWAAQVNDAVSVRARPNGQSEIRRSASGDDLLLVTGVAHGVDGDESIWWATTEGYVPLPSLRKATDDVAQDWHRPVAADAAQGRWVRMRPANVRAAPSTDAPRLGEFKGGETVKVLGEVEGAEFKGDPTWYRIDGGRYPGGFVHASLVQDMAAPKPTTAPAPEGPELGDQPWLVVDRATHTLTMVKNGEAVFATFVALGKAGKDTPDGTYPTFLKYIADRMTSASVPDAERSYNLPNVPYPMYFKDDGSAIHGTYWHDAFGSDESQGCINVTWGDSEYLFQHTLPAIGEGQVRVAAPPDQATQLIIVH